MAKPVIMIVDDEEDVVNLWQRALLMEGFEVIPTFDGISAIDIAESEQPSLILLDIMMPMMNGYEVCQQLKANPMTQQIPVLCVTSAQNAEVASKARAVGAQGLLVKPFTTKELVVRINRLLSAGQSPSTSGDSPSAAS